MDQRPREEAEKLPLGLEDRARALDLVREAVDTFVRHGRRLKASSDSPLSHRMDPVFVTLTLHGTLRGCIGLLNPQEPLDRALIHCAIAAASEDHRFPPVSEAEIPDLGYEISLLSQLKQARSLEEVEVGRHGLFLQARGRQGLLLPQVAKEHGWDREKFLEQVCRKAGLPPGAWKRPDCRLFTFTADVFGTGLA